MSQVSLGATSVPTTIVIANYLSGEIYAWP